MEIILLEKVEKLGVLGDIVKVRPGYARNFLIPQGKATAATEKNKARFEARRAELEQRAADTITQAEVRREQLTDLVVTLSANTGGEGRLFGSIGPADIADAVSNAGIELKKHEIRMPHGPIRIVGEYDIDIHLHGDINTQIKVNVISA